jgi:hypothetical protein
MVVRTLVVGAVLAAMAGLSAGARAAQPEGEAGAGARCSLGDRYPIRSVSAFNVRQDAGYTSYQEFRGAEVIVPAQPGLTREWLQRVLSVQVADGTCDLGARDVTVSVLPAGDAFSVRLSGNNERAAGEILRHAQQLVR